MSRRNAVRAALAVGLAAFAAAAAPGVSHADVDPLGCTQTIGYNTAIPTWDQWFADNHNPQAVVPFGAGAARAGGGAPTNDAGTPPTGRNLTTVLYDYWDGLVALTANDEQIEDPNGPIKHADGKTYRYKFPYQVIKKVIGTSANGRPYNFYVAGTRQNMANLDAGANDAAFWRGVREGTISTQDGLDAAGTRPAFTWSTATPHGDESAAGESLTREVYELLSRTDCENARRMQVLDMFLMPVRNPDGHDAVTRTTAWGFDPNRDFGTQNQQENGLFVPLMNEYPGVFFIDAHQQGGRAYFFPPNEDPVHHEISSFALNFIQDTIGPALQDAFNDQSDYYQNYNQYDLFTPEYGDTVPSLLMGAAGMTYEKGNANIYSRQIYDHYLAIDTTINVTANSKFSILSKWVAQWGEAVQQGKDCKLQENTLVSPLHDHIEQQPQGTICGYFFKPTQHAGDMAAMINLLRRTGVRVYKLDTPVAVNGYHEYGQMDDKGQVKSTDGVTVPAGTLWIPLDQGTKHWINSLLEENPWIPYSYYYDVVTWSYPLNRGLSGSGFLTKPMSPGIQMTEIDTASFGTAPAASPVYAFNTDSVQGIALAADLLSKGVNVYRAKTAFTSGGTQFYTGAALVDGASLAGKADIAALSAARNTPVSGLANYPVAHYQMAVPKIGLYTNSTSIPSNPLIPGTGIGHCAISGGGSFCTSLFTLAVKDKLPASIIVPVTSTELTAGRLANEHFTAFINPGYSINAGTTTNGVFTINATGTAIQTFVNGGGIYVGTNTGGASSVRPYLSTVNTASIAQLLTPGSTFDATFDTTNPVAWGFDLGGWIYRDSNGNPVFDGSAASMGNGKAVASYAPSVATTPGHYGYQTNAAGLAGRPAIVDTPAGSGHTVIIGYDAFYRAWKEQDERLVLNAAMYPIGAEIAAGAPSAETAQPAPTIAEIKPADAAAPEAKLVKKVTKVAPAAAVPSRDVLIRVKRADGAKLKAAVKAAKLSKSVTRKISYKTTKTTVTLVIKGVRTSDEHARRAYVSRIQVALSKRKVNVIYGLV